MNEEVLLLWLSRVDIAEVRQAKNLLKRFRTATSIWDTSKEELEETEGVTKRYIEKLLKSKKSPIEEWLQELTEKRIKFISIKNRKYPDKLKKIDDPPIGIYVIGTLPNEDDIKVGIVGTRRCTMYGENVTVKLAKELASKGVVIVSGMADGIDACAHRGALSEGGFTVAVLGCGVDICYPKVNEQMMDEIKEKGCIISEYPPQTGPHKGNFPRRNRIISGLSHGIIVTEAGERSGASITATLALEQGREVGAVPGNITSPQSVTPNTLLQNGAAVIRDSQDVFDMLGITYDEEKDNCDHAKTVSKALSGNESVLYEKIGADPISVDELVSETKLSVQMINTSLTMLELSGFIQKIGVQRYIRL